MLKFPAALIVPAIFVPQVKDWPAVVPLQQQVDLTVFFLILLCVAILLSFVFGPLGQAEWPLRRLLAGQGKGIAAFFLFAAIVAVSYLYTPAPNFGWRVVSRLWGIGGLLFMAPLILVRREKDFRHFVLAFLLLAVALAVAMFVRIEFGAPGKMTEFTMIAAGWLMGMAVLLLLYFRLFESRRAQLLLTLFCLPFLTAGLFASVSRGPILSLVPVLVVTSVLLNVRQSLPTRIVKLLGVLAFLLVTYTAVSSFAQGIPALRAVYEAKGEEVAQLWEGTMTPGSGGKRLPLYQSALQAMSERPFFGLGVGGWSVYYYGRDQVDDPHNLFLQVGAEQGVVGLIALLALLGTTVYATVTIFMTTGNRFLVLPALLMFVMSTSMFSGNVDDDRLLWIWCGMTFAVARMVRELQIMNPAVAAESSRPLGSELSPT